jgi:glycerol-1-phosphate dehydrogenase [NAD(P)+]
MDVIADLLAGRYRDPETGPPLKVPVRAVVIERSLKGREAELVRALDLPPPHALLTDQNIYESLGRRVEEALPRVIPIRLAGRPVADERTAAAVMRAGVKAGSYIAVGSGTLNDLAKLAAARQNKAYAVFATAPSMNGYASATASITVGGLKQSLPAAAPRGIFCDLGVLAAAPKRLIAAGLGDFICRSTAQADWLLSHRLLGTPYRELPYRMLDGLEEAVLAEPEALARGDMGAIERLMRLLIISGLGLTICGTSAPGSQGEHLISHYIETMAPAGWQRALHGEEVAVATLVMARLQEAVLAGEAPVVAPDRMSEKMLTDHFGGSLGTSCWNEVAPKMLDRRRADEVDAKVQAQWPKLREALAIVLLPPAKIEDILRRAGAPVSYRDLDLGRDFFANAIWYARAMRNRYTFLDLATASDRLSPDKLMGR